MFGSRSNEGDAAKQPEAQVPAPAPAPPAAPQAPPSAPPARPHVPSPVAPPPAARRPRSSRLSVAWAGMWAAALVFILLIVFVMQNTRSVQVSFFGLHGTLPLAMALLIAMVGGILLTLVFGTARIAQLRRLVRRSRGAERSAATGGDRAQAGRRR